MKKIDIKKPFKGVFFILLIIVLYTKATSADLFDNLNINDNRFRATTLDLSQRDTANNNQTTILFNITGIIPNGFKVESLRIKRDGEMKFRYRMHATKTAGDDILCRSLELTVVKDWQVKYQGALLDFAMDSDTLSNEYDDWIFQVKLKYNGNDAANKTCNYNFVFRTWKNSPDEKAGFFDEESISNHITSGVWK